MKKFRSRKRTPGTTGRERQRKQRRQRLALQRQQPKYRPWNYTTFMYWMKSRSYVQRAKQVRVVTPRLSDCL